MSTLRDSVEIYAPPPSSKCWKIHCPRCQLLQRPKSLCMS